MNIDQKFWDKIAQKYAAKPVPDEEIYAKKLEITRSYLTPESSALEFGCGTGTTALKHAPDLNSLIAYDLSPEMLEIARQKQAQLENTEHIEFRVASVDQIEFGTSQYDLIMGHSILHLIFDLEPILRKIHAGLKPGGVFVSGSGCLKDMNPLLLPVIAVMRWIGKAPRINRFSAAELVDLHQKVGFEIAERWDYKKGELYLVARKTN